MSVSVIDALWLVALVMVAVDAGGACSIDHENELPTDEAPFKATLAPTY